MQLPTGIKRQALFQFSFQLSQGRAYNLKKVPQKHASTFAGGTIRVCRSQGSHCKLKLFSIFTMGPRSSRGLWGHAPPENFEN